MPRNWQWRTPHRVTCVLCAAIAIRLQGVTRRTEWCKQRHAYIMKQGESASEQPMLGPDGQPLDAAAANNTASLASLTKQQVCVAWHLVEFDWQLWDQAPVSKPWTICHGWCPGCLQTIIMVHWTPMCHSPGVAVSSEAEPAPCTSFGRRWMLDSVCVVTPGRSPGDQGDTAERSERHKVKRLCDVCVAVCTHRPRSW